MTVCACMALRPGRSLRLSTMRVPCPHHRHPHPRDRTSWHQVPALVWGTATAPPPPVNNTIGVGTATTSASGNNTIGVGTTRSLRKLAGRPPTPPGQGYAGGRPIVGYKTPQRPTVGGKQPRRPTAGGKQPRQVPRRNTHSPSHSSSSSSNASTPSSVRPGPSSVRPGPSSGRVSMNQAQMQRQLEQILQDQQQTAAGRRVAGITTTNTITTTYKNGRRPTVTRNSTSLRN